MGEGGDPSSNTPFAYGPPTAPADGFIVVDERLDVCVACGEQFVVPERVMGLHDNRLVIGLRCASCGTRKLAIVRAGLFEDLLSRYDDGYAALERDLESLRDRAIRRRAGRRRDPARGLLKHPGAGVQRAPTNSDCAATPIGPSSSHSVDVARPMPSGSIALTDAS